MKKILSALFTGFVLLVAGMNSGYAQNIMAGISNTELANINDEYAGKENIKTEQVITKAIRNFLKSFKNAERVTWYKTNDGFMVYFYQGKNKNIRSYDLKGNWIYNLVSYDEKEMPMAVWNRVKSVYYQFSIIWVNEIQISNKTIYVVHLEDQNSFKNIRVCDDEMDVIEEISKN